MRLLPLAALALLLAGCSSAPPPVDPAEPQPEPIAPPEPLVLAEGTFPWHPQQNGLYAPLTYYNLASQAITSPCVFDGQPYFNNLDVPLGWDGRGQPQLAGNLTLTMDWEATDWPGSALYAAYKAPGQDSYRETEAIPKGETRAVPIALDPGSDAMDWDLWLCINSEGTSLPVDQGHQPGPFLGSVRLTAVFTPDAAPTADP